MVIIKKLIVLTLVLMICGELRAKEHPFLFTTRADIERAKAAVKTDPVFAEIAADLVRRTQKSDISELPSLDFKWYEKKPLDINLYTYHKPLPWATLARDCARASVFEPSLAAKVREILLHLSHFEFGPMCENAALNHARVAALALDAYDIIYDTLSDADRASMDGYFKRLTDAVMKANDYWVANTPGGIPVNNHVCWHNLCIGMYGLFYDKHELVNRSLYGPRGMEFMMSFGFRDSGLWGEASLMYHFVALFPILQMAEILENAGYPVSLYAPTADGRDLKQVYDSFFQLVMPDMYFPRIGDTYGKKQKFTAEAAYEILYSRFNDPRYAWLINKMEKRDSSALFYGKKTIPKVNPPSMRSVLFPEQGYAFLRTCEGTDYWNGNGWTLMAGYSDVYVHRHLDKLAIILFGDGHLWLADQGQQFIGKGMVWDVVKGLNRHTVSHNTVMVDDKSQNDLSRKLDLVEFQSLPSLKRVTMADYNSQLYPGVTQMRTCIATEKYVIDVFQISSKNIHKYSWVSNVAGQSNTCSVSDFGSADFPKSMPWIYLKNAQRSRQSVTCYNETFSSDQKRFAIDVSVNPAGHVIHSDYCLDDSKTPGTQPSRIIEVNDKTAVFVAVYRTKDVELPVQIEIRQAVMNSLICELTIGTQIYKHRLPALF
ncbi:MAG: hypothetical protein A2Y12_14055 [Planctomycetes bacterium GWF2_42_9]|nr:MAG: hypothetical protein A2Y12_14055 [Planctomycetes bacterium GWF2_42_9]